MPRISNRMAAWWDSIPHNQELTCRDCGRVDTKAYVQPQYRKGYALCAECIDALNRVAREERKRQLAEMPRCVLCRRRGTFRCFTTGDPVLLCGHHKNAAERGYRSTYNGAGVWLPPPTPSRDQLLRLAQGGTI